ncbi:MAG: hypothetical protein LBE91_20405 [Tannerella sp.]|nr:hypothetical protein [Tannerella sp.]
MAVVIVLLLVLSWLIFRNIQRKRRIEKLETERKLLVVEEKLSDVEQKLREAQQHLKDFIANIAEKEQLIEQLIRQGADENLEELHKLKQSVILTPDDWEQFKIAFETVHPTFFRKVRKRIPDITAAELRLLALVKIKMTKKEIAAALGVSINSIHNTWHRIRKKIPNSNDLTVEKFVGEFRNRAGKS